MTKIAIKEGHGELGFDGKTYPVTDGFVEVPGEIASAFLAAFDDDVIDRETPITGEPAPEVKEETVAGQHIFTNPDKDADAPKVEGDGEIASDDENKAGAE